MSQLASRIGALALVALVMVPLAGVARADGATSIRGVEMRDFPLVRLTVSTEESASLAAEDVVILENGAPVRVVSIDALGGSPGTVDAVLVIDTSNSMAGPELETALAAARTFMQGVPPSLPVGLVSFASEPIVRSPITDDRASVETAVASLTATTTQGTALFDSIVQASEMFTGSGQHNVIVLTDGRCRATPSGHGPCTLEGTLAEAVAAAKAADVSVFTLGLSDAETAVPTLAQIASQTGGTHTIISLDELESVYAGLARELSQQFVVTYRSKAPYGSPVSVEVQLPTGTATTKFLTPGLSTLTGEAEATDAGDTSATTSNAAIAIVAGLVFLAFLNLIVFLQSASEQRRRESQLRSRLVVDPSPGAGPDFDGTSSNPLVPRSVSNAAERTAGKDRSAAIARRIHQAGWSIRVGEFLALALFAALAAGAAGTYFLGPKGALIALPAVAIPFVVLSTAATKRLAAIQAQLADTLMVIASSLRAGHSFLQSLDTVTKEIGEPGASEFGRTMSEIRFGRDVDEALDSLVERVGSRDLEWAVTAIKIQRKIGGNLAEVLESVAKTIRERDTLRRQVKVLSAEGRISAIVLTVLPLGLALYLTSVNPDYLRTLTTTRPGLMMLSAAGGLMVIGYIWMKRIVNLDDV